MIEEKWPLKAPLKCLLQIFIKTFLRAAPRNIGCSLSFSRWGDQMHICNDDPIILSQQCCDLNQGLLTPSQCSFHSPMGFNP